MLTYTGIPPLAVNTYPTELFQLTNNWVSQGSKLGNLNSMTMMLSATFEVATVSQEWDRCSGFWNHR